MIGVVMVFRKAGLPCRCLPVTFPGTLPEILWITGQQADSRALPLNSLSATESLLLREICSSEQDLLFFAKEAFILPDVRFSFIFEYVAERAISVYSNRHR